VRARSRARGLAALFADIDDAFGTLDVLVSKPMSLSRGAILMLPSHDAESLPPRHCFADHVHTWTLWNRKRLEELRWPHFKAVPEVVRIVVAIDPAASSSEDADETGIILAGKDANAPGRPVPNWSRCRTWCPRRCKRKQGLQSANAPRRADSGHCQAHQSGRIGLAFNAAHRRAISPSAPTKGAP